MSSVVHHLPTVSNFFFEILTLKPIGTEVHISLQHWLGAYRTYALCSGHIFVRFNDIMGVFT